MNQKAFFLKLVLLFFVIIFISGCGYEEEPNLLIDDTRAINNPPDAPISCSISDTTAFSISISWNVATDSDGAITGYNIYMSTTSGSDYTLHGNTTETVYTVENLNGNTTYYFLVTAVDNDGTESIYSSEFNATTLNNPPEAPTDLTAANPTGDSMDLSWSDATDSDGIVTGYNIYITTSGFNYVNIGSSVIASYTATNLDGNTMYYFVVTAVDNDGSESIYSSEFNTTTLNNPPEAATDLTAANPTGTSIDLSWSDATDSDGTVTGYDIYITTTSGSGYQLHGSASETSYTATSLNGNTTYYFVVTAVDNDSAESAYSAEASAATLDLDLPVISAIDPVDGSKLDATVGQIWITYSEEVTGADSVNNYAFSGNGAGSFSIDSVTDLGNNIYGINISGTPSEGSITLTISNVTDLSGNGLSGNTITYTGWWNADWSNRRKLSFSNILQPNDLINFPVLINLDSNRIDYNKTQDNGEDIRFVDEDGVTVLSHEIEEWNESGVSSIWVKAPVIDSWSDDDFIWMYYGNSTVSDAQNAEDLWDDNYTGVWHFGETGTNPRFDSTLNTNHGLTCNYDGDEETTGVIGGADEFDGVDDYIEVADDDSLDNTDELTIEAWVQTNSNSINIAIMNTATKGCYTSALNSLGYSFTEIDPDSDVATLNQYNIIFVDFGNTMTHFTTDIGNNLVSYVTNGGNLFLSGDDVDENNNGCFDICKNLTGADDIINDAGSDTHTINAETYPNGYPTNVNGESPDDSNVDDLVFTCTTGCETLDVDNAVAISTKWGNNYVLEWGDNIANNTYSASDPMARLFDSFIKMTNESRIVYKEDSYGALIINNSAIGFVNATTNSVEYSSIDSQWNYLVFTYNKNVGSQNLMIYLNGDSVSNSDYSSDIITNNSAFYIGQFFSGKIDEVRISNIERSAAWIAKQYQSMDDDFITFGNEE